jgi:multidrug efflux pump subunit AcrA (membrane-fusion protein)
LKNSMSIRSLLFSMALTGAALAAGDPNRAANSVILNEVAVKNLNLTLAEALETDFEDTVFALGRIETYPGKSAVVSTRVAGRAVAVLVEPDQEVAKGEEVVRIESRQPGDPPPTVALNAPLGGLVSKLEIKVGQPVSPESSLMEIVDLSSVHALARVPEHLAHKLKRGQMAHIRVPGFPEDVFESKLEHVGAVADAQTGTLEAVFHVENPDKKLRPGMRAEFSIVTGKREGVMSIPREAVQGDGADRFVYVADYELKNTFVKTPVVLGGQNDRFVEVTSGLLPGDQVVTRGAYALVFAGKGNTSLKEALDAAHGHPHAEDGSELTEEQIKARQAAASGGAAKAGLGDGFTPVALFFAATTGFLFILLIALGLMFRRRATATN